MRILARLLLLLALLWPAAAGAIVQSTIMGNSNLTIDANTTNVVINQAFSAGRTLTIPYASVSTIGQSGPATYYQNSIVIYDFVGAISGSNTLTIQAQTGDTINGGSTFVVTTTNAIITLTPVNGSGWLGSVRPASAGAVTPTTCTNQFVRSIAATGIGTCATVNFASDGTGIVPAANGGAGTVTGALKANGTGTVSQASCSDLSGVASSCSTLPTARHMLVFASGGTAIPGGTTTILSTTTGFASNIVVVPFSATVKNLYTAAVSAPVGVQTYQYTLFKNGSTTGITCTVTGAATTCNDTTHTNTVIAGDALGVQLITSATAANAFVSATIELDVTTQ